MCVHHAVAYFWERHLEGAYLSMDGKRRKLCALLLCLSLFFSCRKWFQMKGIKVDNSWKNQSCCISKGILSVFQISVLDIPPFLWRIKPFTACQVLAMWVSNRNSFALISRHISHPSKGTPDFLPPLNYGFHFKTVTDVTVWTTPRETYCHKSMT